MAKGCFRGCMGFARYGLEVTWGLLRVAWVSCGWPSRCPVSGSCLAFGWPMGGQWELVGGLLVALWWKGGRRGIAQGAPRVGLGNTKTLQGD